MIEVRNLTKRFGTQTVLDGISFALESGESVAVIGRSGVGKSVLVKHLAALMKPDAGEVRLDDQDLVPLSERELLPIRSRFGMLFQGAALFDSLTVAENIAFSLGREDLTARDIGDRVAEVLELVELPGIEAKLPAELSGGMKKRVGLARAIVHRPEIILYDEPTTGLDPMVSDSIDQLMMRVNERLHATTLVVTHDMRTARRLGERVLYLHGGRIYLDDTAENVFMSRDPVVSRFIKGEADLKEVEFA
ncbi:MAG: ABC transporter ATP-binding protein [Verrucomicrobiales bacterium]|nr:ABC transporter ATP-binding protein [Verrucomicrobiales bacterium]|tara:strand:+ start:1677 stop:2423 length:747 start_codon:yes stop_codon:yes gene_type:complete